MADTQAVQQLYARIRDVPNFPKPGVMFKDITPLLLDAALFRHAVELMAAPFRTCGVSRVISIESRGFLLGAPIALALEAGLVPIRKPGKLPAERGRVEYALEYGTDALEMHRDAVSPADRVLIVDDVLATGGTAGVGGTARTDHGDFRASRARRGDNASAWRVTGADVAHPVDQGPSSTGGRHRGGDRDRRGLGMVERPLQEPGRGGGQRAA